MNEQLIDSVPETATKARSLAVLNSHRDCRICLGPHDEEIHEATLSVRRWFRDEVTKGFDIPGVM